MNPLLIRLEKLSIVRRHYLRKAIIEGDFILRETVFPSIQGRLFEIYSVENSSISQLNRTTPLLSFNCMPSNTKTT